MLTETGLSVWLLSEITIRREQGQVMSSEERLEPMSDIGFRGMVWLYKFYDLFRDPRRSLGKIPLKEGMTVVDYGCGPGRYTLPVARLVGPKGKVFAIDIHPLAVNSVKKKAESEGLTNVEAILVNSYNTGIESSSVDLVLLIDTFPLVKNHDALFREIHRMLKQDGLIFMAHGRIKMSKTREIVEGAGLFTIVECRGRNILVAPKAK